LFNCIFIQWWYFLCCVSVIELDENTWIWCAFWLVDSLSENPRLWRARSPTWMVGFIVWGSPFVKGRS
jgi:hypothetical protein